MKNSLLLTLIVTLISALSLSAQIPDPIVYFDFEGDSGDQVVDKGTNGNNGTITKPGQTTLGDEGAPGGPSPSTGVNLSDGLIEVPGVDLSDVIGGEGSYTLSAWIKPTNLSGDKFLFGQTTQGIHNGIRNNGFLHQAHWGADTNGATLLTANEWVHAAFTYEGSTDTGTIYLNGEVDWTGQKNAPNGSGTLIIGGRNGGEAGYVGLADEIAMWDQVLDEGAVKALADGASPSNQEDDDEDGLPDFYEERLVDNLEDLNGNADGPGPGSGTGDFDGDGLSDLDEYEETRTNPTKKDTDEDGLNDNVETNTGQWVSVSNTGTDPLKTDSDNDTLVDGVENPDLPYNEDDPEDQPGTDPNNSDTDGDGSPDGRELVLETNPTVEDQPDVEGYVNSFEGYADGTTDLGDGTVINGAAASIVEGRLQLTIDGQGLGYSSFSIPAIEGSSKGFRLSFDYELNDSVGANDPADGFSINYGDATLGELGGAEEGMVGPDSKAVLGGVTENLSFEVDTWRNGDSEQGLNISGVGEGSDLGQLAFENGVILEDGSRKEGTIEIEWNPQLGASFKTTGMTTNADFSGVDTTGFVASDDHNFIFSARVGGANQDLFIDNLVIEVGIFDGDEDGDGLPDFYENELAGNLTDLNGNAAGPGPGAGTGDFDGDGLTDLDEYEETTTNPIKADTDEDGLSDTVETNTGNFVSATNTGTDPKKADTDNDGLIDSVETNTGVLVDEENTGTDPNNADTDGDDYKDGAEIAGGTDPNDENSKGALPAPFLYLDFEDNSVDLSGNANDGEVDGDVTFDVEGAEGGPSPTTGASFNGGHLDFPGIDMNSMIRDFEDGSYTFACWMKPIGSAGGEGFMWGQTQQGIHNGIRNGGLLHSAHWGADWNASTVLEAEQWVHAAWVYDGVADEATIYLNGQIDGGPQAQRAANGGGSFIFGGRNNGEIPYNGYVDDVTIWREVLPDAAILALADGASPIGATQEDEDGDGLPDAWEEKYGVDDPEGDPDGDGLTNVEEYELRTKPDKADSDEDGLSDKAEIEIHETNPLNPDADKDGLLDGEEIAAGTDPDKKDTDEDGISDFNELQDGTDPLVKTAIAFDTNLVSYWSMDGTFDNVHTDDYHGEEQSGPIEFQTGKFGDAAYLNGTQSILISGDENAFDFAGESFTVSAWYTAEVIDKSWQCLIAKGEGNGWRVHRRGGDNPPEMTFTGGNGDVDRHNVAMTVGGDPETWHHVAGVTDASTSEQILYLDGEEVARKSGATLQDRGNPMRIGDNPDAANRNWQGKVDDVAIWGRALAPFEVADIWNGGDGKSIEEMLGLAIPFEFTNIIYNAAEDGFRLEWNSKPNKTYALYFSETLEEFDADIDDSITSQGETTVYPGEDEWLPNPLEGAPKLFFRIEENQ